MLSPAHRSVFDIPQEPALTHGLREITGLPRHQEPPPSTSDEESKASRQTRESVPFGEVSDRMFCSACQCPFDSREDQIEHYKLDWHRFNLRQRLAGRLAVTVEEFEKKTGTGDMSSISGSDSEDEDSDSDLGQSQEDVTSDVTDSALDTNSTSCRLSSKLVFQNTQGQYLSMFRCMVQKPSLSDEEDPVASLLNITPKTMWIILMTGGGHFAGAVYQGKEVLQHKTFHRYTVRAKRGTAQGLRDSQNRSHAPKSAGAALRRYNEAALVKDIQDLLESWSEHLKVACAIFLRAPSYNKSIFFGGRAAPLDKKDPRVRVIPFATRRATFREVKRVHEVLSTVQVYEKDVEVSSIFSPSKKAWQRKARKPVAETNPEQDVATPAGEREEEGSSGEDSPATQLETVELTLGTLHLREHEVYLNKKKRRRRKEKSRAEREESSHKGRDPSAEETEAAEPEHGVSGESRGKVKGRRKPKNKKQQLEEDGADDSREYGIRDALYTACKTGDVDTLRALLKLPGPVDEERAENDAREPGAPGVSETATPRSILNKPIDSSGFTLLHVAAAAGQKAVVTLLMDAGSDPASRDNKGQTPYGVAPEKDTRNTFRKYMAENPKKYDYTKAQVPGPLTAEIEAKKAEKKKAQKAAKKQREKEQKEEKQKKELEKEERKRFAALSDREKRALAAERRLAEQMATTEVTIANIRRCWLCGESLLGKVPFHYLDYSFCSPRCVQAHRKASAPAAKP